MKSNQISGIVPIASWDFSRSQLLFQSLNKFFDKDSMNMLFIIYPEKEKMVKALNDMKLKFPFTVYSEQDIVPPSEYKRFKKRKGWYRQQIMKLYIAKQVKTEHYICLDSDVLCIKPTSYDDLIKNGRISINIESKTIHQRWWKDSLKVLKVKNPKTDSGMSSSTNIFITKEVLGLIEHIESLYKKPFITSLFNWFWVNKYKAFRMWTEYKLYWLYIEHRGVTDLYDYESVVWGKSIWKNTEVIDEALFKEVLSAESKGYFSIVQGNKIDDELASKMAHKYLNL